MIGVDSKKGKRSKGCGNGSRIIRTERRPAFQAKNRHGLPFEIPLSWSEYFIARAGYSYEEYVYLVKEIMETAALIGKTEEAAVSIERAKSEGHDLKLLLNWLRAKAQIKENREGPQDTVEEPAPPNTNAEAFLQEAEVIEEESRA